MIWSAPAWCRALRIRRPFKRSCAAQLVRRCSPVRRAVPRSLRCCEGDRRRSLAEERSPRWQSHALRVGWQTEWPDGAESDARNLAVMKCAARADTDRGSGLEGQEHVWSPHGSILRRRRGVSRQAARKPAQASMPAPSGGGTTTTSRERADRSSHVYPASHACAAAPQTASQERSVLTRSSRMTDEKKSSSSAGRERATAAVTRAEARYHRRARSLRSCARARVRPRS